MAQYVIQRFDHNVGPNGSNTWMDKTSTGFTAHLDKAHHYANFQTALYWMNKLWPHCTLVQASQAVPHPSIKS